jgi:heat-inducible transcriptional repressor
VDIGARAKKILHAVVSEYLATGEAVGSQTVTRPLRAWKCRRRRCAPVMGDLEEAGLLKHAHTSGGRLPTERGPRYYVDMLLRVRSLTTGEKDEIRERLSAGGDVPDVMQRTSRLLRELSHLTVVVQAPRPDSDVVQHLEFVQLREGSCWPSSPAPAARSRTSWCPVDFR